LYFWFLLCGLSRSWRTNYVKKKLIQLFCQINWTNGANT
jgi:hypothetical protein